MKVRIKIHHYFMPTSTGDWINSEAVGETVRECLDDVIRKLPALRKTLFDTEGNIQAHASIFINGEDSFPEELNRKLSDGDEIDLIPLIGGG